jgi:hypothetical protein
MTHSRERAKDIILEIIRQTGPLSKTKLFKTFWLAHLYYYRMAPCFLSDWPVVRLPRGPGIDQGHALLRELESEGRVSLVEEQRGPFTEVCCRPAAIGLPTLAETARQAIKEAVDFVRPLSAQHLGEISQEHSRSCRTTPDGQELDIYTDLLSDEEYERRSQELAELDKAMVGIDLCS